MSADLIKRLRDALEFHDGFVRHLKYGNGEPLFIPSASITAVIDEADAYLASADKYVLVPLVPTRLTDAELSDVAHLEQLLLFCDNQDSFNQIARHIEDVVIRRMVGELEQQLAAAKEFRVEAAKLADDYLRLNSQNAGLKAQVAACEQRLSELLGDEKLRPLGRAKEVDLWLQTR